MKKRKWLRLYSLGLILCSSIGASLPTVIHADATVEQTQQQGDAGLHSNEKQESRSAFINSKMEELLDQGRHLGFVLSYNRLVNGEISVSERLDSYRHPDLQPWGVSVDDPVTEIKSMSIGNGGIEAAHEAELTNHTSRDQVMRTAAFTTTQDDTVTTQTSHTVGTSMSTSVEKNFLFGTVASTISVNYDFNTTRAISTTQTKTWEIPADEVTVPAGKTYVLRWLFEYGTASGTVDLSSNVSMVIPTRKNPSTGTRYGYNMNNAINHQRRLMNTLGGRAYIWPYLDSWSTRNSQNGNANIQWTDARYNARIGTRLLKQLVDITDSRSERVIKEIPMDITPETVK